MPGETMQAPDEVELKLELAPGDLERIAQSPLLEGADRKSERLVSRYFDTSDRVLHQAGYTLRVREAPSGYLQTVKQERADAAGLFIRPEWERAIAGREPALEGTGPLGTLVERARLGLAFTTDVTRSVHILSMNDAAIEVALDHGTVRAGRRRAALCELELELKSGAPAGLFALAKELNALVPLRLGVRSKAERGYALAEGAAATAYKAEPVLLDPAIGTADGFAAIAAACLRHFRLNEPVLLATGSPQALHQSRVALRRLRSAFSSFKPLFAGDLQVERLRQSLRWLAGELGPVRDLDVLIPKVAEGDRARLVVARAAAWTHAHDALNALRARELMIDLVEWLAIGAWRMQPTGGVASAPLRETAAALLRRHRRRVKRGGGDLRTLSDHDRHQVRIEAKKLRYASEFLGSLWPGRKEQARYAAFIGALEHLQEQLGALNDQVAAADLLARHNIAPLEEGESRKHLLKKAEKALEALVAIKPFWR